MKSIIEQLLKKEPGPNPLAAAKTWIERIRTLTGEPVSVGYWYLPKGPYVKEPLISEFMEGIRTENDGVVAIMGATRDGSILHPLASHKTLQTQDWLLRMGFHVADFNVSSKYGFAAISSAYVGNSSARYKPTRLLFTVMDPSLYAELVTKDSLPDPMFLLHLPCTTEILSESVSYADVQPEVPETPPIAAPVTIGFFGKLALDRETLYAEAEKRGYDVITVKDIVPQLVVTSNGDTPARYRGTSAQIISLAQFTND